MDSLTFTETRRRSLAKAFIYRVFSVVGTIVLGWLITRDAGKTISITIAFQIYLTIIYFISERVWNRISWGKEAEK